MEIVLLGNVEIFLEQLTPTELAKSLRTLDLLEKFGHALGLPHSRHLSDGLLELRIRGKRELRIFYCFNKGKIILLHAIVKKTEKTSERDLKQARNAQSQLQ